LVYKTQTGEKAICLKKNLSKKRRPFSVERAKSFLCFQMNSIGDAIMTQPAWASLKSLLPEARIDLVCRPHIAPLFKEDQAVHSIFSFENRRHRSWLFKRIPRLEKLWWERKYDLLIDFTALPLTAVACARESAPPSIGFQRLFDTPFDKIDLGLAYDKTFPFSEEAPLPDLMVKLVSPWVDGNFENRSPRLTLSNNTIQEANGLLEAKGLVEDKFIVFHPGGKWPPKRWPLIHWRALMELLKGGPHLRVLFLGSQEDSPSIQDILKGLNGIYAQSLICDQTDISAAIIKRAVLCVCNDSAAMHMAAAVGTKSISMFGPVRPERSAPSEDKGCNILYDDMSCSPCTLYYSRSRCRRGINFCMYAVKPETVYRKIKQIIK
jgi:ADP-heptose:LPS heptosyltransferase